ncbi:unnamed protein product [Echinostoma caproni]|uniref:VWFD domain-containing protein n=1 Tax=Echinostoma caproni TaxID=27848 RepID=A0A183A6X4_9TREM|nr:unnamed protein product [Echinostoma caproni]
MPDILLSHPILWISPGHWNITIDSWNQFRITNFNETTIASEVLHNGTHGVLEQTLFVNNGLLNMTHLTSLRMSPFQLNSLLTSRKGRAWITGYKQGAKEYLIEAEHSRNDEDSSAQSRRKDLVARFFLDPENTIHANLNWRPGLINELLLHGTELTDMVRMRTLLRNPVPIESSGELLLSLFADHNRTALINHHELRAWREGVLDDMREFTKTLRTWWEEDHFYMKTSEMPVIEQLGLFNVTELDYNISQVQEMMINEILNILKKAALEDLQFSKQLEMFKPEIERDKFPLFRPTFEAMARMVNGTIWASEQFANFLFNKVAACTNAVYILQQGLRNWFDHKYAWIGNLSQSPFVQQLGEFFTRLQSDIPALKPMSCFTNMMIESISALVRQTIQYCKRLALDSFAGKELQELVTLMATGHFENASRLFFKPHLTQFTADLENGLAKLSVHIPILFEKITETLIGSQSYPKQLLSWIYPSRGMKSIMYAYDQYQRNFEAMRKLIHLIPPYKVTAWLLMDQTNNGYIITFNGLYIPVAYPHPGPYLLVANTDGNRKLRVVHQFADSANNSDWHTDITVGPVTVRVTSNGQVQEFDGATGTSICLPYVRKLDSNTVVRVTRNEDRITLSVIGNNRPDELISMLFDLRLGHIRIQLDGSWHGQCRGLLGTNDFEQLHELFDPSGAVIWNQTKIAGLWSYASQDQTDSGQIQNLLGVPSEQSSVLCNSIWQKFQSCFMEVPPDPWIGACASAMDRKKSAKEDEHEKKREWDEQSCMVVRAYVQTCNRQDVPVRVPHQCVSCSGNEEKKESIQSSDTLGRRLTFVIEMGTCLTRRLSEIFELCALLNKSKQNQQMQYSALLFTTVSGATETTRLTSNTGQIWISGEQFVRTLHAFVAQQGTGSELKTNEFVEWPRATEALSKAVRQPAAFDGSHDTILLYLCSGCTPEGSQYKTLIRVMKRKGIDFHYIPESSFITVGDLNRNVFLLTSDEHYDEVQSDGSIRRVVNSGTVNAPRDHCTLIAQGSGGFIWAYQNVITTKQRLRVVVQSIANHLNRPGTQQRQCVCRDDLYGAGMLDCSIPANKSLTIIKHPELMPIN